jgi:hypothetical protein
MKNLISQMENITGRLGKAKELLSSKKYYIKTAIKKSDK